MRLVTMVLDYSKSESLRQPQRHDKKVSSAGISVVATNSRARAGIGQRNDSQTECDIALLTEEVVEGLMASLSIVFAR